jgi:adenylyltransferase/sulfurtransferase
MCLGHIGGARFVPLGFLEREFHALSKERDMPILVYCSSGTLSLRAVERLRKMGFSHARSIAGGYNAWLKAGSEVVTGNRFSVQQLDRYSRNMLLREIGEEGQMRLMEARVLLVGAGGLASSAGLYLAACGIGTVGIVDFDTVGLSNLNRQVFHGTEDVGRLKVDSARAAIERINPDVKVVLFAERLVPANAIDIIGGFDIVMDASDNVGTKFLLNDACCLTGKPYVFGGAVGFDGQAAVFWPREGGPCLRCLFPQQPPPHLAPSCSQVGVLGVVPGQIGLVQATEAIKLILRIGTPMIGKFYIYNALTLSTRIVETGRNPDCPLCGESPVITSLVGRGSADYGQEDSCGR